MKNSKPTFVSLYSKCLASFEMSLRNLENFTNGSGLSCTPALSLAMHFIGTKCQNCTYLQGGYHFQYHMVQNLSEVQMRKTTLMEHYLNYMISPQIISLVKSNHQKDHTLYELLTGLYLIIYSKNIMHRSIFKEMAH